VLDCICECDSISSSLLDDWFGDEGMRAIVEALKPRTTLKELHLRCKILYFSFVWSSRMMINGTCRSDLNLQDGGAKVVADLIRTNQSIQLLDLSCKS